MAAACQRGLRPALLHGRQSAEMQHVLTAVLGINRLREEAAAGTAGRVAVQLMAALPRTGPTGRRKPGIAAGPVSS